MILAVSVDAPDVLVSRDGGKSFEKKTPPALPIDVVVDPSDPQHWAVSTEQGTFVSTNGGDSWRPRDTTVRRPARLAGARTPSTASTATARSASAEDGGQRWEDRGDVGGIPSVIAAGRER